MRTNALFSLVLVVSLSLAAAGIAFIGGKAAADPQGAFERGVDAGERFGRAQTQTAFAPGEEAYESILARGREEGAAEGRRAGRVEGVRAGRRDGRRDAFGRFPGGWEVGRWYLVNVAPGRDGARYGIGARVIVDGGRWYAQCRGRSICQRRAGDPAIGRRSSSRRTASP
jgi:hypothetical protein